MIAQRIDFPVIQDERGKLVSLEHTGVIPFEIKRIYYLFELDPSLRRGFHAHKKLSQVIFCINGSCNIKVDNGHSTEELFLDSPEEGFLIKGNIWREMYNFSQDCILVVVANAVYEEEDYIRNYDEFLRVVNES